MAYHHTNMQFKMPDFPLSSGTNFGMLTAVNVLGANLAPANSK